MSLLAATNASDDERTRDDVALARHDDARRFCCCN